MVQTRHVLARPAEPPTGGGEATRRSHWLSDWLSTWRRCLWRRAERWEFLRRSGEPEFHELEPGYECIATDSGTATGRV